MGTDQADKRYQNSTSSSQFKSTIKEKEVNAK